MPDRGRALTRRSPLRAKTPWRRTVKPKSGIPAPRPGELAADPKGWKLVQDVIRLRDRCCRRCGFDLRSDGGKIAGVIDHAIPRRLLPAPMRDQPENLALLCPTCHGSAKALVEDRLFERADCLALEEWIRGVATTGPVPTRDMLELAYKQLRVLKEALA